MSTIGPLDFDENKVGADTRRLYRLAQPPGPPADHHERGYIDFYNKDCVKTIYTAGQSFSEGADPHAAVNTGSINARLLVAYVIKSGEPRRIERPQPNCAAALRIP